MPLIATLASVWVRFITALAYLGLTCQFSCAVAGTFDEPVRQVLIVVGPSNHPPGTHEVAAGARVIEYCIEHLQGKDRLEAVVVEGWPADQRLIENAATIVFSGDRFPIAELDDTERNMRQLSLAMDRGCGIFCFHYATGLTAGQVPDDGSHPLLDWMGGYFATRCLHHQSVARVYEVADIVPADVPHPVLRGCKPFTLHDEPYIKNYFGPRGMEANVTALASSMLPPENPQPEVVAWAVERKDGGRGMGIVMPHFFKNWNVDELRTMIINGVVWTSGVEVPPDGFQIRLPPLEQFRPDSVEFRPRAR